MGQMFTDVLVTFGLKTLARLRALAARRDRSLRATILQLINEEWERGLRRQPNNAWRRSFISSHPAAPKGGAR